MRIGIDCGVSGAIVLITHRTVIKIWDMPTYTETTKSGKNRNFVCGVGLDDIFAEIMLLNRDLPTPVIFVEKQGANKGVNPLRKNKNGDTAKDTPLTAYSVGYNYSSVRETLRRLKKHHGFDYEEPVARDWKKRAGLISQPKSKSLQLARELFGELDYFKRVKDHDRAEAALIAYFGE